VNADGEVNLASLNLHGGRRADGSPFDVEAACTGLKADVIALQEVWRPGGGPDPAGAAADALGARVLHAPLVAGTTLAALGIASERAPGDWGLAVITALPVDRYEVVSLGRAPGDPVPRGAQLVTATLPGGGRLRIANTHLTHRYTSPVQLLRLVRLLRQDPAPTVIVGDLNMPGPVSGLAPGYSRAVRGRTFPAHWPLVQLDHMLATRDVRAGDGEVAAPAGSDHLPIRARLRLG
jgi:endonuclease/exonuclease/phosphatase family metal-dependent hydrolase